jgi:hypothetical protein
MSWNDVAVVLCDSASVVCLGLLGVSSIGGVDIHLSAWQAITLFAVGKAASTTLSYLKPPGSARADLGAPITPAALAPSAPQAREQA